MDFFTQISLIIGVSIFLIFLAKFLKQPLIISYIISGIIVGPYFLNLTQEFEALGLFAQIGVALLLFIVGLGLSPLIIREVGKVSLITGVGQVLFTSIIGFFIAVFLGFDYVSSAYIAVALTFSSTIIIMKLLSDRRDTETLYGKIAIGFLVVQDIIAMLIIVVVSAAPSGGDFVETILFIFIKGIILLAILFVVGVKILPKIMDFISNSQEFLLLFSLGWCFILSALFKTAGFSMEIGALLAGVTLAMSPYRFEVSSKMRVLRDFFLLLFFISLGSQLTFGNISQLIFPIIVFSIFILLGNPLIVIALMGLLGYTKRNGFLAGLTVAQISEFSIILVSMGIILGHLNEEILLLITIVGLITIAGSSYMILYSDKLYPFVSPFLKLFERKGKKLDEKVKLGDQDFDCILLGCNRIGYDVLKSLKKIKANYIVVDYNPDTILDLTKEGIPCKYGDSNDSELLNDLPLNKTKMIVSTIPNYDTNYMVITKTRAKNKSAIIIVVSYHAQEAVKLYEAGATYVVIPQFLGGHFTSTLIEMYGTDLDKFLREKMNHLKYLEQRKKYTPEHFIHEIK